LTGVLFACVAGVFFGAMNITMRRAVDRLPDVEAGSAVIAAVAFVCVAAAAVAFGVDFDVGELWPLLLVGIFVPGLTQLLVVHAVRDAGASRAGILFGMAPLFSVLFAILAFGEPLRWPLAVGTLLVVAGGIALAAEGERPVDYRAYGGALAVSVASVCATTWRAP
jgi:drug/metabolite transporter (DMT)-like permease